MLWRTTKKRKRKSPGNGVSEMPWVSTPSCLTLAGRPLSGTARKVSWLVLVTAQGLAFCTLAVMAKEKKIPRTVSGTVLDKHENGITGATVELTDLATGKKIAIYSEEGGRYKFSDLEPTHDYSLQATRGSLSSEVRKISSFDSRNSFVINLKIEPPPK